MGAVDASRDDSGDIRHLPAQDRVIGSFLGAAVGDALGWPQEERARRVGGKRVHFTGEFVRWTRWTGGRFNAHEETIQPGEYSDDTQLILCTARSLQSGNQWLEHFVRLELPSWHLYQRGAGGAVGRAVASWTDGRAPWQAPKPQAIQAYRNAGGNGAAMRILPHAVLGADRQYQDIAPSIMANAIATHGHPRAILGALLHGYACWLALRQRGTLKYGALLEQTLENIDQWSRVSMRSSVMADWPILDDSVEREEFGRVWDDTRNEIVRMLTISLEAMQRGALAIEHDVLQQLGCFDKKINGAGTVAAAASLFLASRFASEPRQGIVQAAFAIGSDTDTIASMTGSLLGALTGVEWFMDLCTTVQDHEYIAELATNLPRHSRMTSPALTEGASSRTSIATQTRDLFDRLEAARRNERVLLSDGRTATVEVQAALLPTRSNTLRARSWRLRTADGQTVYVKRLNKTQARGKIEETDLFSQAPGATAKRSREHKASAGIRFTARDISLTERFYSELLGIPVTRKAGEAIEIGGSLVFVAASPRHATYGSSMIHASESSPYVVLVHTKNIESAHKNVRDGGFQAVGSITRSRGARRFRCIDPDGNRVDVFEAEAWT